MAFYSSETCGYESLEGSVTKSGCQSQNATNYATSDIKYVIDNWAAAKFTNQLKEIDGNSARLITRDELITGLGCTGGDCTNSSYSWTYSTNYWYWTMTSKYSVENYDEYRDNLYTVGGGIYYNGRLMNSQVYSDKGMDRPVINVKKSAIQNNS